MDTNIMMALRVCLRSAVTCRPSTRGLAVGRAAVGVHHSDLSQQKTSNTPEPSHTKQNLKLESQPPQHGQVDWIGPADPDSNLRPRKFFIPDNETSVERDYRLKLEDTHRWNHEYWASHNKTYTQSKERFIQSELARLGPVLDDGSPRRLSPEQLSVFYKAFLTENFAQQKQYNLEWYRRNIKQLWPAFKVMCIRKFTKRPTQE